MRRDGFRFDPYRPRINTVTVHRDDVVRDANVKRREAFADILAEAMRNQTLLPPDVWAGMSKQERRAHRCETFRAAKNQAWSHAVELYA